MVRYVDSYAYLLRVMIIMSSSTEMSGISPICPHRIGFFDSLLISRCTTNIQHKNQKFSRWILIPRESNPVVEILVMMFSVFFLKVFWVNLLLFSPPLTLFVSTNPRMLLGLNIEVTIQPTNSSHTNQSWILHFYSLPSWLSWHWSHRR